MLVKQFYIGVENAQAEEARVHLARDLKDYLKHLEQKKRRCWKT